MSIPVHISRPHLVRAALAAVVALAGLVAASFGQLTPDGRDPATASERALAIAGAAVLLLGGLAAVRGLASAVRRPMEHHHGHGRAAPLTLIVSVVGYAIVLIATLGALGVPVGGLLLGGAFTGVVVGIAAQQTLGNLLAGLLLLIVRPFAIGERVTLRSTLGEYKGLVTDIGFFYVSLETQRGPVDLPNSVVLASAVGPGASSADDPAPKVAPTPRKSLGRRKPPAAS